MKEILLKMAHDMQRKLQLKEVRKGKGKGMQFTLAVLSSDQSSVDN